MSLLSFKDIAKIFEEIELKLISSLKRNLHRHKAWEKDEGFQWSAWQVEKLRNLNKFRQENFEIVNDYVDVIDDETRQLMEEQFHEGEKLAEEIVEDAVPSRVTDNHFFGINERKMDALMEDVTTIEKKAETAALRMVDDVYRQTVNKVQLEMATGSTTLTKAIDDAVSDFLDKGINCIVYKDGKRVNVADYVRMVLRTTSARATLQGEAKRRTELGFDTVLVSQYGMCSETCLPWQGQVYIDDVFTEWRGERVGDRGKSNYCGKWFTLLSVAISNGLFHPNCRHTMSTYIDGVTQIPKPIDEKLIKKQREFEQKQRALEKKVRKFKRLEAGTQSPETAKAYRKELREAQHELKIFVDEHNDVLRRDYSREKVYEGGIGSNEEKEKTTHKNTPTSVNFDIVNSPEYRDKFKGISDDEETDNLICQKSRDMLMHRNNSYFEDMYLIDTKSKAVVGVQTHSTNPQEISYNKSLLSAISKHDPYTLISIHNHPESKPPSGSDLTSCGFRKYQKGVVCCHNGDVYIYMTGNKPFTSKLFDRTVDKYKDMPYNMNEQDAYIATLNRFEEDYGIKWEVR